jgi:hypothetical protein
VTDPTLRDELSALLSQGVEDQSVSSVLRDELGEFLAKTPPNLGGDDDLLAAVRQGDLAQLLQEAAATLDARLTAEAS